MLDGRLTRLALSYQGLKATQGLGSLVYSGRIRCFYYSPTQALRNQTDVADASEAVHMVERLAHVVFGAATIRGGRVLVVRRICVIGILP